MFCWRIEVAGKRRRDRNTPPAEASGRIGWVAGAVSPARPAPPPRRHADHAETPGRNRGRASALGLDCGPSHSSTSVTWRSDQDPRLLAWCWVMVYTSASRVPCPPDPGLQPSRPVRSPAVDREVGPPSEQVQAESNPSASQSRALARTSPGERRIARRPVRAALRSHM